MSFTCLRNFALVLALSQPLISAAFAQSASYPADGYVSGAQASSQTIGQICKQVDCLSRELRDDGLVVIKQPDVYSPARLTHFRSDFETQMQSDLGNFQLILAARVNRLDAATTTQTTNLSNAIAMHGSTAVTYTQTPTVPQFGAGASLPTSTSFSNLALENKLSFGLEPTIYLDEKKRFLEHLNQIRRINLGPDQNDSSGYGLYLIRIPVSITPGHRTGQGFGAELSIKAEHEFGPDFLDKTFRELVVNDLVDQLGPVVYEIIRSGKARLADEIDSLTKLTSQLSSEQNPTYELNLAKAFAEDLLKNSRDPAELKRIFVGSLSEFILPTALESQQHAALRATAASRIQLLRERRSSINGTKGMQAIKTRQLELLAELQQKVSRGDSIGRTDRSLVQATLLNIIDGFLWEKSDQWGGPPKLDEESLTTFVNQLSNSVSDEIERTVLIHALSDTVQVRSKGLALRCDELRARSLPSTRNPKQIYPIAPREIQNFFIEDNVYRIARDAEQAMISQVPSASDVRNYLRQSLKTAYDLMQNPSVTRSGKAMQPLANTDLLDQLLNAVKYRRFAGIGEKSDLRTAFEKLTNDLADSYDNIVDLKTRLPNHMAAYCWAIAVDAVLLDEALKADMIKYSTECGFDANTLPAIHLYFPHDETAQRCFTDYVKNRWPIITFAIDPVVDQQNIADSSTLNRDLQLALAYAFSTGQISFNQMNTFRRQIQVSADTIALNRTVTGFAHGNDCFGFRFTPRYQNPPNQKTNIGVIATQLISGGPGPNYQIKKSKLEPGMRELTAVMLLPTFMSTMRVGVSSNWFQLTHPERLIYPSQRMLEQGRCVQEMRSMVQACDEHKYRADDLRSLMAKIDQLDLMLKSRSTILKLPYDNTASGFDLLSDGATALVPELSGFEGIDVVTQSKAADVFIYGKYINLLDTKVIVGGRVLPSTAVEILSREVIHVTIPPDAAPTVTKGDTPGSYLELYLATPNGISNRLLIPSAPAAQTPVVAYNLNSDSQSLTLFYQWLAGADAKSNLVATVDPGASPLKITWDSPTGLAPKTLQVTFIGTLSSGQTLKFTLKANGGSTDDFGVDRQQLALMLLNQLQSTLAPSTALPASIPFDVYVQPWLPLDTIGYRVRTSAKKLNSQLTISFQNLVTGANALQNVKIPNTTLIGRSPSQYVADSERQNGLAPTRDQSRIFNITHEQEVYDETNDNEPQLLREIGSVIPIAANDPQAAPGQISGSTPNQLPACSNPANSPQQPGVINVPTPSQIIVTPSPVIVNPATPAKKKHKHLLNPGRLFNMSSPGN